MASRVLCTTKRWYHPVEPGPSKAAADHLLEAGLPPRALIVAPRRVEHPALSIRAHPGPRLIVAVLAANLEHGAILVQYGDEVTEATVNQVVEWWRGDPNGVVIAPYPKLGNQISLGAWNADPSERVEGGDPGRGILAKCPGFDEGAFDAFKDAYAFKGPERFDKSLLAPS